LIATAWAIDDSGTQAYGRALDRKLTRDAIMGLISLVNPFERGFGLVPAAGRSAVSEGATGFAREVGGVAGAPRISVIGDSPISGLVYKPGVVTSSEIDAMLLADSKRQWSSGLGATTSWDLSQVATEAGANNALLPGGSEFVGPLAELDSKILFGAAKPGTNKIIGGHSPDVLNSPLYEFNPNQIVNPDGTISLTDFKATIVRKDGTIGLLKAKSPNIQTVAPPSWGNVDVLQAGEAASNAPGVVLRNVNGVETTVHTTVVKGVQWQVIKDNGVVTSSFPTGGRPIVP
jgi:hypothetical protein